MKYTKWAPVLVLAGLVAACEQSPAGPDGPLPQFDHDLGLNPETPTLEQLRVCKVGDVGASFSVTYSPDISGANPGNDFDITNFDLAAGECLHIATAGFPVTATIVESAPAMGFHLESISVAYAGNNVTPEDTDVTTRTAEVTIGEDTDGMGGTGPSGATVTFENLADPTGGGQGCTPGYWKQSQHFDSWADAGYDPDQLFSSVFEDAFPGMTLLQVLSTGGGGLNALGRHTVAALLNAANPNVSYDVADVIGAFNAVFPGGDYEGLKNIFAGFNEQGCPLN